MATGSTSKAIQTTLKQEEVLMLFAEMDFKKINEGEAVRDIIEKHFENMPVREKKTYKKWIETHYPYGYIK